MTDLTQPAAFADHRFATLRRAFAEVLLDELGPEQGERVIAKAINEYGRKARHPRALAPAGLVPHLAMGAIPVSDPLDPPTNLLRGVMVGLSIEAALVLAIGALVTVLFV